MDVSRCPLGVGRDAVTSASATDGLDIGAGDESGLLRKKIAALREANLLLRIENSDLKVAAHSLRESHAVMERSHLALEEQIGENKRSLGWIMIQKASYARRRLFREGQFSGRCWNAFSRFTKTAIKSGPKLAVRKAVGKIHGKLARTRETPETRGIDWIQGETREPGALKGFLDLPWRYLGDSSAEPARKRGHYKVLMISHSACRTGAPLCFRKLAEELTRLPDVECWIVLQSGGELADSFARLAPTLDIDALAAQGPSRSDVPGIIAQRYREYSSRGIVVCNTAAVSDFHAAFSELGIPVLSWIHELPVSIDNNLGGKKVIDRISAASRRIIVPADAVRDALIDRYAIHPDRIRTLYYGLEPRTRELAHKRQMIRRQVREELGIPEDAPIVLGCGSIDLRKGVDMFARLCRLVLTNSRAGEPAADTRFIWVGPLGYRYFQEWLIHDAQYGVAEGRLIFTGPREDTVPYLLAADLFALTSREDPCPFVNLEAMESGLAVVAFQDSGGAPEVLKEAGACVSHLDVDAMAKAARELLNDPAKRTVMGRLGQTKIRENFTWHRFMEGFSEILRTDFNYRSAMPLKVSVIVPNYRHARFLEQRLRSIFTQTLRPHEIIFLDNASPDDSVEVARRLSHESPVPMRIIVNERNNGSTFRQWMKGLSLATGDLGWIAEADDSCRPQLLERLVPEFYDPEVVLAYCQSATIGPEGEVLADHFFDYTDDLSPSRWRSPYSVPGTEEVELALSQKNSIPNASAVVFRLPPSRPDFADELENLRFAGDWLFYAMQLRGGKISYVTDILNLFRRHPQTNTYQVVREDTHVEETLYVKARVFETFPVSTNAMTFCLGRTVLEYNDLTHQFDLKRPILTANPRAESSLERIRDVLRKRRPATGCSELKILLVLSDLGRCRESLAMIQLANALASDHEVFLCNARPSECHPDLVARVEKEVICLEGTLGPTPWSMTADPLGKEDIPGQARRVEILRELIRFHRINVIHSRSRAADRLTLEIVEDLDIPWFTCLESGLDAPSYGEAYSDYSILLRALRSATGVFYEHETELNDLMKPAHPFRPRLIGLPVALDIDRLAAVCFNAYDEACKLQRRQPRESTLPMQRDTWERSNRQSA